MTNLDIQVIKGVHCYIDDNGVAQINLEDAARGLGVTKTDRKNGVEYIRIHKPNIQRWLFTFGLLKSEKDSLPDFIPEPIFYLLAMKADNEIARAFQNTIAYDVLPTIRKHGAYMTQEAIDKALSDPDTIIQLATQLKEERAKRQALQTENAAQKQMIAEYEPKIQYVDQILSSKGTLAITQIAADYGMSAKQLNSILHEEHVQHSVNGQWILYKEHMDKGYTKSKTVEITHSDGTPDVKLHTRWTQKGRLYIHEILTKRGIKAVIDREPNSKQIAI